MFALNLPSYDLKIIKTDKLYVWDIIRRKYVSLTPEEWVRQNFIHFLINEKQYPKNLIANEIQIKLNNQKKRCDSVIYNANLDPLVIIEYKAPDIDITQSVFNQIANYNLTLKVKYLIVSNGIKHYCCLLDYNEMSVRFLNDIPNYTEIN